METLSLFDPATSLRPGSTCVIIGHQNAGKTTLAYNFLQHVSGDSGLVVSHERMPLYPRLRNRVRHWAEEFRPELLGAFLAEHRPTGVDSPSFALLDCCIYDSIVTRNPAFRALFEQSRSRQITALVTMLYAIGLPPAIRASTDWALFFRECIPSNVRRIYDMWFSGATAYSLEQIQTLLKELPFYTCLVLNTQTGQLFQHTVIPLARLPPTPSAIAALTALPTFQPTQLLKPGDYCAVLGSYSQCHATLLCSLVLHDISGGFLLREPKGYPGPRAAYATIQDRVRTDVSGSCSKETVALRLARHLLDMDLSGSPTPSFVLLDDWFPADQVPFQFLYAHRQERQILLLSSQWGYKSLDHHPPPDYLFCATILDGLRELCPASIPYDTFFDMMLALGTDSYIVLCRRTGAIMRYTPTPVVVSYI